MAIAQRKLFSIDYSGLPYTNVLNKLIILWTLKTIYPKVIAMLQGKIATQGFMEAETIMKKFTV
jgi:hypothetical protein